MKVIFILMMTLGNLNADHDKAQTNPSVEEVQNFFSNSNILISYREGEVIYGTYYFIEIHYCPQGYGLYGNTVKKTVLGNEQRSNWQEFGTWKVQKQDGRTGIYYAPTNGNPLFVPIYRSADGSLMINQNTSMIKQGQAICN